MQHTVSSKTLIKASITASLVAIIAFVLFILPAEYNIDPKVGPKYEPISQQKNIRDGLAEATANSDAMNDI